MGEMMTINGEKRAVAAATVIELLEAEAIDPTAKFVAVAVNGSVVPRRSWPDVSINPGDDIEIVHPAPGG
ncbi:MAG TPA: thiamine biosynthesis protein ThiS [Rhodospirillaceae bacterium]|nr:thiamine biosynthesis protein ThiS [Rhodospirillaceae bacterium]HAA92359.1 thiamine biosynthesis protein ThiS [Rhodospirillaceae bacterium]HAT35820.1 thiamine biosynthesis protein ThiS [Rhodospirillaceae bacterium]|tara:strand:+ start:807 stop:1016 length:210 start_codon:yes stop_codon:yes gene_type:complete